VVSGWNGWLVVKMGEAKYIIKKEIKTKKPTKVVVVVVVD